MKSLTLAPAAILLTIAAACSSESGDAGAAGGGGSGLVILDPTTPDRPYFHDFGQVPYGGSVAHVYRLENTDPVPVTVRDILPSCGCTAPRIRYTAADGTVTRGDPTGEGDVITLPPGAVAELEIRLDTEQVRRKNLDKLATVHLRCDSHVTPFIAFELHVVVDLAFQAAPAKIDLGRVGRSAGKGGRTDIVRDPPGSEARILRVAWASEGLTTTLEETVQLGKTVWVLVATLEPLAAEPGWFHGRVDLETTDREGNPSTVVFRVPVTAMVEEDLYLDPRSLVFRSLEPGVAASCEVRLASHLPGHRFEVAGTELVGRGLEHLSVEAIPDAPDDRGKSGSWTIRLSLDAAFEGPGVNGAVSVQLADPTLSPVRIPFLGRTRRAN